MTIYTKKRRVLDICCSICCWSEVLEARLAVLQWCAVLGVSLLLPGESSCRSAGLVLWYCVLSRQHKSMIAIINPGKIEVEGRSREEENRLYLVHPSSLKLSTPDTLSLLTSHQVKQPLMAYKDWYKKSGHFCLVPLYSYP